MTTSVRTFPLAGFVNQSVHRFESGCLTLKLSLSWKTVTVLLASSGASEAASLGLFPPSGEMGIVLRSTCSDMLNVRKREIRRVRRMEQAGIRARGRSLNQMVGSTGRAKGMCVVAELKGTRRAAAQENATSRRFGAEASKRKARLDSGEVAARAWCEWKERPCTRQMSSRSEG